MKENQLFRDLNIVVLHQRIKVIAKVMAKFDENQLWPNQVWPDTVLARKSLTKKVLAISIFFGPLQFLAFGWLNLAFNPTLVRIHPENSKRAHFEQTQRKMKMVAGEGKNAKFWAPHPSGPLPSGQTP